MEGYIHLSPVPYQEVAYLDLQKDSLGQAKYMLDLVKRIWPDIQFSLEISNSSIPFYITAYYRNDDELNYLIESVENCWPDSWENAEYRART